MIWEEWYEDEEMDQDAADIGDDEYSFEGDQPGFDEAFFDDLDVTEETYSGANGLPMRKGMRHVINHSRPVRRIARRPNNNPRHQVRGRMKNVPIKHAARVHHREGTNALKRVIVPDDRKVIIENVGKFVLDNSPAAQSIKNIRYYKGRRLSELTMRINNADSSKDFNFNYFDPDGRMSWFMATGQDVNDKITIGSSNTTYSQFAQYIMSNPIHIINVKVVIAGNNTNQINRNMVIQNKNIDGREVIDPLNVGTQKDAYQFQNNVVFFNMAEQLNRPYVPDGMDVMGYTVYAGCTVTFAFFYEQKTLKKFFFEEVRNSKKIL